jgi:hypothetical protein
MINFKATGKLPKCKHCHRQLESFTSKDYPFEQFTQDLWPKQLVKPLSFKATAFCSCQEVTEFNIYVDEEGGVCYQYE